MIRLYGEDGLLCLLPPPLPQPCLDIFMFKWLVFWFLGCEPCLLLHCLYYAVTIVLYDRKPHQNLI